MEYREVELSRKMTNPTRDGLVVLPSGMDSRAYLQNPIILAYEGALRQVVGKASAVWHRGRFVVAHGFVQDEDWGSVAVEFVVTRERKAGWFDRLRFGRAARRIITGWKLVAFSLGTPLPRHVPCRCVLPQKFGG